MVRRKLGGLTVLTALLAVLALLSVVDIASRVLGPTLERRGGKVAAIAAAVRERVDETLLATRVRIRRLKDGLAHGLPLPGAIRASRLPRVSWGVAPSWSFAAATADRLTAQKEATEKAYPVLAAAKIFAGTMVAIDNAGFAKPASDAANLKVVGIADAKADNTDGANGDIKVKMRRGVFKLPASSITQAMVGKVMYVVDDQTFDDALGTNGVKAGRLVDFVSTTEGWIEILGPMGQGVVLADADATYGQPEADLINDLKLKVNSLLA